MTAPRMHWSGHALAELLALEAIGPMRFRNRLVDRNVHDRIYGGQLLAQSLLAASRTLPEARNATSLQFLFLQGALCDQPIDYEVTALQDGKRFSSRQVRGTQQGRLIFNAQMTFALSLAAPAHSAPSAATTIDEDPETLPGLDDLPADLARGIQRSLHYPTDSHGMLDVRYPLGPESVDVVLPEPRLRYWARVRQALPDDANEQAAAFAYLSDWWFNYVSVGGHRQPLLDADGALYVASLNHAIWLHRAVRADEWLHFDCTSPVAAEGRGFSIARVHDRAGRMVASVTQECLMAVRE